MKPGGIRTRDPQLRKCVRFCIFTLLFELPTNTSTLTPEVTNGTKKDDRTTQTTTQTTAQTTTQTTTQTTAFENILTPVQLQILEVLKENPKVSRKIIAEILGNISVHGVKYHLKRLQTLGIIKRTGAAFGGSCVIEKQND